MSKTLFITGGAGYVGAMLIHQFADRPDVAKIIALDKEPIPDLVKPYAASGKLVWITSNLADSGWEEIVSKERPDTVIHTAWQIREMYGNKPLQWKWNVEGSDRVFDYAFTHSEVKRLVHFSTVSSYAAYAENEIEHFFKESEPFRESDYLYAIEKKAAEDHLKEKYESLKKQGKTLPQVFVVRPAAITGPRGRYMRIRFGLQAALSGQLKENSLHKLISLLVSWVPVTKKWCRQFIHEDDVADIVSLLTFSENLAGDYEVFNICPPGDVVRGKDMAEAVGKRMLPVHPRLIQVVFFIMWHISRGKVPTSKGGWKSYSYPIAVDGSKLTKLFGYKYKYPSKEAFVRFVGRYTSLIPKENIPPNVQR